jgi:hypothetical protein
VRGQDGWREPLPIDEPGSVMARLCDDLLAEDAIDVVCGRDSRGGLRVRSRRGAARLSLQGDTVRYAVEGADPFDYPALPAELSRRRALELTAATDYPDALVQLGQVFESPRTGDLIVSAAPGHDLRDGYERPPHVGSHGSLRREHMLIPLFVNHRLGPGPFRATDVYPTILAGLGLDVPSGLDGQPLPFAVS